MPAYISIKNYYLIASTAYHLQSIMRIKSLDTGTESISWIKIVVAKFFVTSITVYSNIKSTPKNRKLGVTICGKNRYWGGRHDTIR